LEGVFIRNKVPVHVSVFSGAFLKGISWGADINYIIYGYQIFHHKSI